MEVIICKDYEELSKKAAELIKNQVNEKPNSILGLATGSSPIGLYKCLIDEYKKKNISFAKVKTYNLDEYCGISRNHPQSYYSFMHENLFDYIDIDENNVHLPQIINNDYEKSCKMYNDMLNSVSIDLQVLGIGPNGHIGFNEPNTPFNQETFIVDLTKETREANKRFFNDINEVPTKAITMGINNIMKAKTIVLVASGEGKAQAIKDMIKGPKSELCPASALQDHKNVYVFIDTLAAKLL